MACGLSANYPQLVLGADDGRRGRGGGVPPSYAHHLRLFPAGRARHGAQPVQPRPADRPGAGRGVRRRDRRRLSAGACAFLVARRGRAWSPPWWSLFGVREPVRGGLDARRRSEPAPRGRRSGRPCACSSRRRSWCWSALASGATQFVTYGAGQLHHAVPDAREGHDPPGGRALVRAGGRHRHGRRHLRLGPGDRPAHAAREGAPMPALPALVAVAGHPALRGLRLGAELAAGAGVPARARPSSTISTSRSAVALVQEEVAPQQRVLSGALLLLVMNLIGLGSGPTFVGAASDCFRRHASAALAANGLLRSGAVLLLADRLCFLLRWRCAMPSREASAPRMSIMARARHAPCPAVAPAPVVAAAQPAVVDAPAGAVRGEARGERQRLPAALPYAAAAHRPRALAAAAPGCAPWQRHARRDQVRPGLPAAAAAARRHLFRGDRRR